MSVTSPLIDGIIKLTWQQRREESAGKPGAREICEILDLLESQVARGFPTENMTSVLWALVTDTMEAVSYLCVMKGQPDAARKLFAARRIALIESEHRVFGEE